jgi:hypothetical protein
VLIVEEYTHPRNRQFHHETELRTAHKLQKIKKRASAHQKNINKLPYFLVGCNEEHNYFK